MRGLLVVVIAVGCSSGPNVGDSCGYNRPVCEGSLDCMSSVPGGYCTIACSMPGSTNGCPDDSICADTPPLGLVCLRLCDDVSDCGRTDVTCSPVPNTHSNACKPG